MKYIVVLFFIFILSSCAVNHRVMVGDSPVVISHLQGKGKTFVHLHHNEQTALKAARTVIRKEGGSLITLIHSGGRTIVFHLDNTRYEFDPNRIFTNKGIKKTLSQYGKYTPDAHREVNKLALELKQLLPKSKVVAVHNNSSYSLKDYLPGHILSCDAQALYMNPHNYFRNFYLVTRLNDYQRLKLKGFNGVLQKNSATDDGSLSIFMAKNDYINVEAGYDQLLEQIKMLQQA